MQAYDNQSLYESLKELDVIDSAQLDLAYESSKAQNIPLEDVLVDKDLISDENLGRTIAEITSLPLIRLSDIKIPKDVLDIIPQVVAKKQLVIAFKKDKNGLHIALADPRDVQIKEFVQRKTGLPVTTYITTKRDIKNALFLYSKDLTETFDDIIQKNIEEANSNKSGTGHLVEPPIIKIVDTVLSYAYQNKASDIHIEPLKNETTLIRFRIDGVLHDILTLPHEFHQPIVTRIKVLADLRTDEHKAAQDGKFQYKTTDEEADVRVSVVPITGGEKIVMRLLSERSRQFSLTDLGFSDADLQKVKSAYQKPFGMILSTGPTGSGKTTSIYAVLKLLNKRDVNIMTIEDPVEYAIDGVNQIQVNVKTNLTFAEGLRSIVRQDPNIILVGEIRDEETADIAINSAMTGHLVLSTLHTNDAATAIPRLLDMGIEPYLLASTINIVIGQRLVRKIHTRCRISEEVDVKELTKHVDHTVVEKFFGKRKTIRLYKGKGCEIDHNTGYEGRVGIFEVLVITEKIRQAITDRKDASTIRALAVSEGMNTMIQDGLEKIKEGITTIEEIIRVTKE